MVKSPCINICELNSNEICKGCYRSLKEIDVWNISSDKEKKKIIKNTKDRRIKERGEDYYGFPVL